VWVTNYADDTVSLIDPVTRQVSGAPIPVGDGPLSIAAGAGAVWVANTEGTVSRIEP
jgi:YVTN family beta-propeller protein